MGYTCQHEDVEEVFGKYDRSVRHEARLVQIVISLTHIINELRESFARALLFYQLLCKPHGKRDTFLILTMRESMP
jgi:hypothetical protein